MPEDAAALMKWGERVRSTGDVLSKPSRLPHATPRPAAVLALTDARKVDWDRYVTCHSDGTLFHTVAWRDAVCDCFPHESYFLLAEDSGRIVGILPLFLVRSRLAGRLLISVPYATCGGILADSDGIARALFDESQEIARRFRCRSIEFRSERAVLAGLPIVDRYVGFARELPAEAGAVLVWLPRKARAVVRHARVRHKLSLSIDDAHVEDVWNLYARNMRRLGSINYPRRFFERLLARTPGAHWTALVFWNGRPVAGLITFLFKDRVVPYFFGCTDEARECGAAHYVYYRMMQRGAEFGYRNFDFGRSRRDNRGSFDFKRFQGFEPRPLGYQCFALDGRKGPNLTPTALGFKVARAIWSHLPLFVTRPLGARLATHIPG